MFVNLYIGKNVEPRTKSEETKNSISNSDRFS